MRKRRLIVLAALEMESRAAAKALAIPFERNKSLRHATFPIEIHTIGMRAELLPPLLASLHPSADDRFWMVGLAGALNPTLRVGDVVIDADPSGPVFQVPNASIRQGQIHTADRLIASPDEKRALYSQTAALAVDMEQRIVREALVPLGISVMGIRAISDSADTALDPALPGLVDPVGRPRWPALAGTLLRRPSLVLPLIRLGRDSARAAQQLARALALLAP